MHTHVCAHTHKLIQTQDLKVHVVSSKTATIVYTSCFHSVLLRRWGKGTRTLQAEPCAFPSAVWHPSHTQLDAHGSQDALMDSLL